MRKIITAVLALLFIVSAVGCIVDPYGRAGPEREHDRGHEHERGHDRGDRER